ncbi:hypothetical protein PYCCODRAFT_1005423 [Trametes coccinea BRFM310]|uniref:Uncharacterized protein n=1 Tax=Trametes coccinea (strain BRFM310) TaxID=1353009 RepID=A0A1Y2ICY9_TRAC3|nr:hypothetical protein PYCCODRAFT_1005423 [Trametes coccinea BRFM310]
MEYIASRRPPRVPTDAMQGLVIATVSTGARLRCLRICLRGLESASARRIESHTEHNAGMPQAMQSSGRYDFGVLTVASRTESRCQYHEVPTARRMNEVGPHAWSETRRPFSHRQYDLGVDLPPVRDATCSAPLSDHQLRSQPHGDICSGQRPLAFTTDVPNTTSVHRPEPKRLPLPL